MRRYVLSGNNEASTARRPQLLLSSRTLRRVRWYGAGTLFFITLATALYGRANVRFDAAPQARTVQRASSLTSAIPPAAQQTAPLVSNTRVSTSANGSSSPTSHVNVNGQDIPVPVNGSRNQTVTTTSGQTSVEVSNTSTQTSDGQGNSSSTFSLNVTSKSTAEGGAAE